MPARFGGRIVARYPLPSSLAKKVDPDFSMHLRPKVIFFFTIFFFFKHVSVSTRELAVEGSGGSATDPISIDCSPAKSPTTGKADKIISIDSSPEPAKAKYLGYAGYGKTIAKVRAGSGKSAMTKTY